jgi:uncharacterized protein (DUF885 family)
MVGLQCACGVQASCRTPKEALMSRCLRAAVVAMLAALLGACAVAPPAGNDTQRLHTMLERSWEDRARRFPEWATFRGDHRFDDRLRDSSPAALADADAELRRLLAEADTIDARALSPTDRVSLELFRHQIARGVAMQSHPGYRTMSLGALGGFHTGLASLLGMMPVATEPQVRNLLARMAALPRRVDEEIVQLRRGITLGYVPPRPVLERVLAQLDGQIGPAGDANPFFEPFKRLGPGIAANEREALQRDARTTIDTQVRPALRKLRDFVAGDYRAAAPASGALSGYPEGRAVYDALVADHTTLALDAAQIHAIGLAQVARLQAEVAQVMRDAAFTGSFAQWVQFLNSDARFFHPDGDALLADYRAIAKRIDPELPKLFAELPRAPYEVVAMPAHLGPDRAPYYVGPTPDGSRPGRFYANTLAYKTRPKWDLETLVAHEAAPGHHLQFARAVELSGLPAFRRTTFHTVFSEGWALYAETLGPQLGLYRDPYSKFGHLQWQLFRAARLVVDTGIHALGWSRERAIDYMVDVSGVDRNFVAAEVDRYTSQPGQALAYMTGQLKIVELRDRARAQLGERFDIRRFHNVVLDQGSVTLPVLERQVDAWIAAGGVGLR